MADVLARFGGTANARGRPGAAFGVRDGQYLLATVHRAENTDDVVAAARDRRGARAICRCRSCFRRIRGVKAVIASSGLRPGANVTVIEPVGYAT